MDPSPPTRSSSRSAAIQAASHKRQKSWIALALSFVAGFVDIAGVITIYDVFTAHMTGTTVRLGQHLFQHDWRGLAITGIVLAAFVLGSIAGRVIIEVGSRNSIRRIASVTLATQTALLATVLVLGTYWPGHAGDPRGSITAVSTLLAMLAAAMGLQTATLTRVGALTVHTTFVTGMLNKLAQLLSHWMYRSYDIRRAAASKKTELQSQRRAISRQARFVLGIWLFYLFGAICGSCITYRWSFRSFVVPCAFLVGIIAVDLRQPFSIEEEQDQSER